MSSKSGKIAILRLNGLLSHRTTVIILFALLAILASLEVVQGSSHELQNNPLKALVIILKPLLIVLLTIFKFLAPIIKIFTPVFKVLALPLTIPLILFLKASEEL